MTDAAIWLIHSLNALQYAMLLFLLSIGLTVIFGLLNFVNLAHGSLYALGAFTAYSAAAAAGTYWAGFVAAPLAVALAGAILYGALVRGLKDSGPLNQVLVTFGLIFVFFDLSGAIWGKIELGVAAPAILEGEAALFGVGYPIKRLFIIGLGLLVMAGLALTLARTGLGAMIRASVDNQTMAACLGVNVSTLFFAVFVVGCALAGLAGAAAALFGGVAPGMGARVLIPVLIVVVIGGLGSLRGAVAGALLVGFVDTFGRVAAPEIASVLIYALLAAVLIWRPQGLFPARG